MDVLMATVAVHVEVVPMGVCGRAVIRAMVVRVVSRRLVRRPGAPRAVPLSDAREQQPRADDHDDGSGCQAQDRVQPLRCHP
jgi:hypothetical protein